MVKGTLRDTIRIDHILDQLADGGIRSIKKRTLIVLRMGVYAVRSMDSVPDHAAVNESVTLARKVARGTDRFVNAVLRNYLRRREELDRDTEDLGIKYSFPDDIVRLLGDQYGEETEGILRNLSSPAPMVLRVNTLMTTRDELAKMLAEEGIHTESSELSDRVLIAEGGALMGSDLFRRGLFTVQSLSSVIAIQALSPLPGSRVLDMCAAPGGKTTMMAEMMTGSGHITACDIHEHRLELIEATAARLGIDIIETRQLDGTVHDSKLDDSFDYVLADVPCSGLGVVAGKPEIKYRTDTALLGELVQIQKEILRNALRYAKPGGLIEYSTCTLNKDENERVVEAVMNEESFGSIVEMDTLLPYNNLVGFYYCIIRKNFPGSTDEPIR